jgi:hypothetical protein
LSWFSRLMRRVFKLKSREQNISDAQRQEKADKLLGPGYFFYPPKTTLSITSYREAEVFSEQQLIEYIHNWSTKVGEDHITVAIQGKYDGNSCFLHRTKDGEFFVFTEDASDVTDRVPYLIERAKKELPKVDYILLGELEKWPMQGIRRVHQGREYVAGELHSKGPATDKEYVWNFHDCLWFNGQDLHNQVYSERFTMLEQNFKIRQSVFTSPAPGFNLVPNSVCKTDEEIRRVLRSLLRFDTLEGAMIKRWDGFKFELDGRTNEMLKFKKYAECHCWVTDKRLIRGAEKTFQYRVAIEVLPAEEDECDSSVLIDFKNKKAMAIADTFNTAVEAKIGDVITVQFHNIYVTKNPEGKIRITLYEPKAYENRTIANPNEEPDTVSTLMKIGLDSTLLRYKSADVLPFELVKQMSVFEQYPDEGKTYKFILHNHWRGKTVHADLRMEHINQQYLLGYTLDIQIAGAAPEVTTFEQAKEQVTDNKLFKFNCHTGEFVSRQTRGGLKKATSIVVELKEPEPLAWLTFQGVVKPGGVGSTAQFPGVFVIAASGEVEYGFRTGYFHEYFFHCPTWKGGGQRLLFRQLSSDFSTKDISISKFLQWAFDASKEIGDFEIVGDMIVCDLGEVEIPSCFEVDFNQTLKTVLPPAEVPSIRTPTMWMMIKPNDSVPYMLSRRATKKERMTPFGVSGIPKSVRLQIPKEFQYWEMHDSKVALKVRQELVDALARKQVELDFKTIFKDVVSEETEKVVESGIERSFVLNRRTWRGPIVVRVGYSAEIYDLWFDMGDEAYLFSFNQDPREGSATGTLVKTKSKELMDKLGEQPAGSPLNPNKKIPVKIERLQKGKVLMYFDNSNLKKFQVKTTEWKGLFLLEQDEATNIWTIKDTSSVGGPAETTENAPS